MGNCYNRLKPEELKELQDNTHCKYIFFFKKKRLLIIKVYKNILQLILSLFTHKFYSSIFNKTMGLITNHFTLKFYEKT